MDAREATRLVREYFAEAHGDYGSIQFRVEAVEPAESGAGWTVLCSLFTSLQATARTHYRIALHDDGNFGRVEKLGQPEVPWSVDD